MIGRRRRGGMSLGRVAKKAAVATVVSRAVNHAMDNQRAQNMNRGRGGQHMHHQPQRPATHTACLSCHTQNPQHAKFCLNCGSGLSAGSQQTSQATPLNHCPGCKANLIGINGNFCPYCRSAIT